MFFLDIFFWESNYHTSASEKLDVSGLTGNCPKKKKNTDLGFDLGDVLL